ncbi:hypothetical protein Alg215_11214, partial [Pyrenophora tritici-repentis]
LLMKSVKEERDQASASGLKGAALGARSDEGGENVRELVVLELREKGEYLWCAHGAAD